MQEALAGLPGIQTVEVDLEKDLCILTYDPKLVTIQQMQDSIRTQGFQSEIVTGAGSVSRGP